MNYIKALQERYSVKKFDSSKTISKENLDNILQAGKLSASSLGLQPYRILVVASEESKKKLIPAFYNPSQISTCSHLLVIVSKKGIDEQYINGYFRQINAIRSTPLQQLEPFRKSISSHIDRSSSDEVMNWNEKQGYILLSNLMFAAALEGVDTCPMEGFRQDVLEDLLEIPKEIEKITVTLALGFRAIDDDFQHHKKVRKDELDLFEFL
ncbi:MAG: NAD(P)H-dependent oxidoreductase [Bacteroidetes bacterium]|nr:NAD(P)H-dependent oxidoreductase [Bacteroidota bacterium]